MWKTVRKKIKVLFKCLGSLADPEQSTDLGVIKKNPRTQVCKSHQKVKIGLL